LAKIFFEKKKKPLLPGLHSRVGVRLGDTTSHFTKTNLLAWGPTVLREGGVAGREREGEGESSDIGILPAELEFR